MARADLFRLAAAAALLTVGPGLLHAEELRSGYELSISVALLDASTGNLQSWQGWPENYSIDEDNRIFVPFLGGIDVEGMAREDLAQQISDGLIQHMSLAALPAVTVDVVDRPPVMVLGLVRNAGPIDFRPGMTVRDALAMTGGVPLSADAIDDPVEARLTAKSTLSQLRQSELELGARAARLTAQSVEADMLDTAGLESSAQAEAIIGREQEILSLENVRKQRSISLLDGRIALLKTEIETLNQKSTSLEAQKDLAKQQLTSIMKLADTGLTVNSRLLDAQRVYTDIESQTLTLRSSILSAQQDIAKAESDRLQIVQGGKAEALLALSQTQSQLESTRSKRILQERLVALIDAAERPDQSLSFEIFSQGATSAVPAKAEMALQPGDVLQVALDVPPNG